MIWPRPTSLSSCLTILLLPLCASAAVASSLCPEQATLDHTTGHLHWLFPLPGMLFPTSSHGCPNIKEATEPDHRTYSSHLHAPGFFLSSLFYFNENTYHCLKLFFLFICLCAYRLLQCTRMERGKEQGPCLYYSCVSSEPGAVINDQKVLVKRVNE